MAEQHDRKIGVLFTPWGEALVRKPYPRAMAELSHMPHVDRVAVQTNISCRTEWLADADLETVALWATYHPTQTTRTRFLETCTELRRIGARFDHDGTARRCHSSTHR